jgi:hypothetical protein
MYTINNLALAVLHTDAIDTKFLSNTDGLKDIEHIIHIALDRLAFNALMGSVQIDMQNGYYIEINTIKKE